MQGCHEDQGHENEIEMVTHVRKSLLGKGVLGRSSYVRERFTILEA
jgi:hypothetical protein